MENALEPKPELAGRTRLVRLVAESERRDAVGIFWLQEPVVQHTQARSPQEAVFNPRQSVLSKR